MITSTVKGFERFSGVYEDLVSLSVGALDEAAAVAAEVASQGASINLEIETVPAVVVADRAVSGIVSRKQGRRENVRIAPFFDRGTLAGHRGDLKRGRRVSWKVRRGGEVYTATRHPIHDGEGIQAQGFFGRARAAGRRALLARIDRGNDAVSFFGR